MDTLETETSSTIVITPTSKQQLRKSVGGLTEQNTVSKTKDMSSPSLNTTYYPHKYNYNNAQNKEYAKVLCDIRNMQVLRTTHRIAIQQFSRDQLLEIIEVYNLIVQNVNYMFS